jgi:hypothetical protein
VLIPEIFKDQTSEQQDHAQIIRNYNHEIKFYLARILFHLSIWAGLIGIIVFSANVFLPVPEHNGFGTFLIVLCSIGLFVYALAVGIRFPYTYLFWLIRAVRYRSICLRYSAVALIQVTTAHNNVALWLANPFERKMRPRLYKRWLRIHSQIDRRTTEELGQKLEAAGIWNPYNNARSVGRTREEALMNVIHAGRLEKIAAQIKATEIIERQADQQASSPKNIVARKDAEYLKEAAQAERENIAQTDVRVRDYPLDVLGGKAQLEISGIEVVKVILSLPKGHYLVTVIDRGRDTEKAGAVTINGHLAALQFSPPIERGELRITGEKGTQRIPLD